MRRVLAATLICLCGRTAEAQLPTTDALGNRMDAVAKQMLSRHTAGASVAVARDGRVILARGYGMANVEHAVAVTPETVFHIASISKNILAAVVLQLVDEGKLNLDDDVTKYIPEAPRTDAKSPCDNCSITPPAFIASRRCPNPKPTSDLILRMT